MGRGGEDVLFTKRNLAPRLPPIACALNPHLPLTFAQSSVPPAGSVLWRHCLPTCQQQCVATRLLPWTATSPKQDTTLLGKSQKGMFNPKSNSLILKITPQRKNLGGIDIPIPRWWYSVTHEDRFLLARATWLRAPRISGEAGYLSPASPPVPQVLCISLIGPGSNALNSAIWGQTASRGHGLAPCCHKWYICYYG